MRNILTTILVLLTSVGLAQIPIGDEIEFTEKIWMDKVLQVGTGEGTDSLSVNGIHYFIYHVDTVIGDTADVQFQKGLVDYAGVGVPLSDMTFISTDTLSVVFILDALNGGFIQYFDTLVTPDTYGASTPTRQFAVTESMAAIIHTFNDSVKYQVGGWQEGASEYGEVSLVKNGTDIASLYFWFHADHPEMTVHLFDPDHDTARITTIHQHTQLRFSNTQGYEFDSGDTSGTTFDGQAVVWDSPNEDSVIITNSGSNVALSMLRNNGFGYSIITGDSVLSQLNFSTSPPSWDIDVQVPATTDELDMGFTAIADGLRVNCTEVNTTAGDAATIDCQSGRFRKDTSGSTFTLTNSYSTTNSIVLLQVITTGLTAGMFPKPSAGNGTVTITFESAAGAAEDPSANMDVNFWIIKQ